MMRRLEMLLVVAMTALPVTASAQGLVLDWSNYPSDTGFVGDAVLQWNLACWTPNQREVCQLMVITIGRGVCPAHVTAMSWRTNTGDLKISRTSAAVDLEVEDFSLHWMLHLKLQPTSRDQFIVDEASGAVATRPLLPGDRIRSTELVALVKGTEGLDKVREWVDIDLKCPKIAVVAAKRK